MSAFFGPANEANVPTVEDAPREAPRLSREKPHARRASGSAQSPRQGSPAPRTVGAFKRFGLGRGRRLRRSAEFEHLLRSGARRSLAGYTFYLERRAGGGPRLGMLVTRKHAAAATERNYIKRCIREAFRLEQHRLGPVDLLIRPPLGARGSAEMVRRLRELLAALAA